MKLEAQYTAFHKVLSITASDKRPTPWPRVLTRAEPPRGHDMPDRTQS